MILPRQLTFIGMSMFVASALTVQVLARDTQPRTETFDVATIINEGLNHSEIMETAAYLTDRIGSRLTNSPQMRAAERWTQQRFRDWGLSNVRTESFEFGRGWSVRRASIRMTSPRTLDLRAIPIAWTPGTNGTIVAPIIVAPMNDAGDFQQWSGRLRGKIVLVNLPGTGTELRQEQFQRLTSEELSNLDSYRMPQHASFPDEDAATQNLFVRQRDEFLRREGAVAWVRLSARDGGLIHGNGYSYRSGATPALPAVEMAAEDYRRLARLARTDANPTLELTSDVQFHDDDLTANNVLADIPGTNGTREYVMAGAHLDSWAAGDGAVDNAAGVAIVMEAARILRAIGARPKRTIRFALWNGEEQGLLGSMAYIDRHLVGRPPSVRPDADQHPADFEWSDRWPITLRPGYRDLVAYFNLDNGSGKIRGIYAEGNLGAVPIFREWFGPFTTMGASTVAISPSRGTDHELMQAVGVPAFQFIQDPLDYGMRLHHTNIDTYDHLRSDDLRQAAVILASFLLNAANRDAPFPRMPIPTRPRPTDPFAYPPNPRR